MSWERHTNNNHGRNSIDISILEITSPNIFTLSSAICKFLSIKSTKSSTNNQTAQILKVSKLLRLLLKIRFFAFYRYKFFLFFSFSKILFPMDSTSITHKYLSFVYIAGKSIFHGILKIFLLNIFRFYFMKNKRIRTDVCINAWNMIK